MRSRLLENHDGRSVERVRFLKLGHGILPQHVVRHEAYLGKLDMQIKKGAPVLLRPFWMAGSSTVERGSIMWNKILYLLDIQLN